MMMHAERTETPLATTDPVEWLRLRQSELTAQVVALAEEDPDTLIRWSNHLAEHAQAHQEWHQRTALRVVLSQELDEIEQALRRAAAGEYGRCVDCGHAIPPRRLQSMPAAVRCVACQARREARGASH